MSRTPSWLVAVLAVACGHTTEHLKEARSARYETSFTTVWNIVSEEVHRRFSQIEVEDAKQGKILTAYVPVELDQAARELRQSAGATGRSRMSPPAPGQTEGGYTAFRVAVNVKGPPWHVMVDGEAALYRSGEFVPIPHGHAAEPGWVQTRIDSLVLDIHDRLKTYAIRAPGPVPPSSIAEKTYDTTPWANLPDRGAVELIGKVHKAALARDAQALKPTMVGGFQWEEGVAGSADTAVALWSADPTKLEGLSRAIEAGCVPESASGDVVCPAGDKAVAVARFRKVDGAWRFIAFVNR